MSPIDRFWRRDGTVVTHDPTTVSGSTSPIRRLAIISEGLKDNGADEAMLLAALSDPDPIIRAAGLSALSNLNRLTLDAVIHALGDLDAAVRQRAALLAPSVSNNDNEVLCSALRVLLEDPTPLCVIDAIDTLARLNDQRSVELLCQLARTHKDHLVVEECVAALAVLGDPRGLDVILEMANGKATLKRRVVAALGAFDGDAVEAALDRLSEDRDWQVRQAVAMLRREPDDLFE